MGNLNAECDRVVSKWLIAFLLLAAVPRVQADATQLSIADCFNPLLVTHVSDKVDQRYHYTFLALVNRENYRLIKDSAHGDLEGFFSADYDHFDEERSKFFSLNSESIDYYRAQSTEMSFLPSSWQGTINDCISHVMTKAGYGLSYFYRLVDPHEVILEVKYVSTEVSPPDIHVRSSDLKNGTLNNAAAQGQGSLYPACTTQGVDNTCPLLSSKQEFSIHRVKPNEPITVTLNFDNTKHSTAIVIPITPKKLHCVDNPDKGIEGAFDKTIALDKNVNFSGQTHGSGPLQRDLYKLSVSAPDKRALIIDYHCAPLDSHVDLFPNTGDDEKRKLGILGMNTNPETSKNVLYCVVSRGTGNARSVHMWGLYRIPERNCSEVDWTAASTTTTTKVSQPSH